jgi:hypothetical protein
MEGARKEITLTYLLPVATSGTPARSEKKKLEMVVAAGLEPATSRM